MTERRAYRLADKQRGTQRDRAIRREGEENSRRRSSNLPASAAVTDIAAPRRCRSWHAGGQPRTAWSASGVARGLGYRRGRSYEDGCGSTMVRVCGSGRSGGWSHDFISARMHDGGSVRPLALINKRTLESLLVRSDRCCSSARAISALPENMVMR